MATAVARSRTPLYDQNISAEMVAAKRWLIWRYEIRDGKKVKVPYQALKPARRASSTNPATWATYQQTMHAYTRMPDVDGIGFALGDGWVGVDLDHVIAPDGSISGWAIEVLNRIDSYTEISPSGTGFHVIAHGELPAGNRKRSMPNGQALEMYDAGRFFTVTGNVWNDRASIRDCRAALGDVHAEYLARDVPLDRPALAIVTPYSLDDDALIEKACATNPRFAALWNGDISAKNNDQSAADAAICWHLAFWTGKDAAQMDRIIRRWCLFRDKWDEKRGSSTYGQNEIEEACSECKKTYSPRTSQIETAIDSAEIDLPPLPEVPDVPETADNAALHAKIAALEAKVIALEARCRYHQEDAANLRLLMARKNGLQENPNIKDNARKFLQAHAANRDFWEGKPIVSVYAYDCYKVSSSPATLSNGAQELLASGLLEQVKEAYTSPDKSVVSEHRSPETPMRCNLIQAAPALLRTPAHMLETIDKPKQGKHQKPRRITCIDCGSEQVTKQVYHRCDNCGSRHLISEEPANPPEEAPEAEEPEQTEACPTSIVDQSVDICPTIFADQETPAHDDACLTSIVDQESPATLFADTADVPQPAIAIAQHLDPSRIGRPCCICHAPLIRRTDGAGYESHTCVSAQEVTS